MTFANVLQKKDGALHHAAAEHDDFWNKHRNQIGEAETKVAAFALDGTHRPSVTLLSQFANFLGSQSSTVRIVGWGITSRSM